jgi:hypothetical protein
MKSSSLTLSTVAAALLSVAASQASADVLTTFSDSSWTQAGADDAVGSGGYVGPGYGGQAFDAEYLFYKQSGTILTIGLQAGFDLVDGHVYYDGRNYYAGDLALSFDGDASTYEYAIDFGLLTKDYYGDKVDAGSGTGIDAAGFYSVSQWNNDMVPGHVSQATPFAMDGGALVRSLLSNQSGSGTAGGATSYYRIVSFDLAGLGLGPDMNLHWTMSCGNDVVNGAGTVSVPEPGSLALFAAGLFGLGFMRRTRELRRTRAPRHRREVVVSA